MQGRMSSAILFDLDGTLADTAPDLGHALNLQLQRHGRTALPIEMIRPHASAGSRGLLQLGFGIGPQDARFEAMRAEYLALYDDNLCRETTLFPGVAALLEELRSRAIVWGIVTNKPHRFTVPLLEQLGLAARAACVVSGDSVPRSKPHPDSLLKAAQQLGIAPVEIIYLGDDERDTAAAHAAGMRSVIAGYGYLGNGNHLEKWGADAIIQRPEEILNYL
jgi:phosphoglycolate phosphatase